MTEQEKCTAFEEALAADGYGDTQPPARALFGDRVLDGMYAGFKLGLKAAEQAITADAARWRLFIREIKDMQGNAKDMTAAVDALLDQFQAAGEALERASQRIAAMDDVAAVSAAANRTPLDDSRWNIVKQATPAEALANVVVRTPPPGSEG